MLLAETDAVRWVSSRRISGVTTFLITFNPIVATYGPGGKQVIRGLEL